MTGQHDHSVHPIVVGLLSRDVRVDDLVPILVAEDDAKPHVIALLRDRNLQWPDAPGGGLAPARALFLVGKLGWLDATDDVLALLEEADPDDDLYAAAVETLVDLGPDAVPAVLHAARRSIEDTFQKACAEVIAGAAAGTPGARVFLESLLGADPELAAAHLATHGDPGALNALHRALQAAPDPVTVSGATTVREVAWAIADLGGALNAEEGAAVYRAEAWLGRRRVLAPSDP